MRNIQKTKNMQKYNQAYGDGPPLATEPSPMKFPANGSRALSRNSDMERVQKPQIMSM